MLKKEIDDLERRLNAPAFRLSNPQGLGDIHLPEYPMDMQMMEIYLSNRGLDNKDKPFPENASFDVQVSYKINGHLEQIKGKVSLPRVLEMAGNEENSFALAGVEKNCISNVKYMMAGLVRENERPVEESFYWDKRTDLATAMTAVAIARMDENLSSVSFDKIRPVLSAVEKDLDNLEFGGRNFTTPDTGRTLGKSETVNVPDCFFHETKTGYAFVFPYDQNNLSTIVIPKSEIKRFTKIDDNMSFTFWNDHPKISMFSPVRSIREPDQPIQFTDKFGEIYQQSINLGALPSVCSYELSNFVTYRLNELEKDMASNTALSKEEKDAAEQTIAETKNSLIIPVKNFFNCDDLAELLSAKDKMVQSVARELMVGSLQPEQLAAQAILQAEKEKDPPQPEQSKSLCFSEALSIGRR